MVRLSRPIVAITNTSAKEVRERSCYEFSSTDGDNHSFSDHRRLDSTISVFATGAKAVSTETAHAATAPAQAPAARRRSGLGD